VPTLGLEDMLPPQRLLQERKISVTETAYMLGYEKVSAFISMFKKVHSVSPGSLK
jgi:AraC-like DNA-binding protein